MSTSANRPTRPRGFVAIVAMLALCWIAAIAGLRALIVANAAIVSRAYDSARQEGILSRRLERVVSETTLAAVESGRAPASADPAALAGEALARLDAGGVEILVTGAPAAFPSYPPYPSGLAAAAVPAPPGPGLLSVAGPQLRAMMGRRVVEHAPQAWSFSCRRRWLGVERTTTVRLECRIVEVPLSRYPVLAYELPSEIGMTAAVAEPAAPVSALPPGLAAGRDPFQLTGLLTGGARPYHYRRRAGLSLLCGYLGSQDFVNRAALAAGPALRHDLGVPESETARLSGFVRTPDGGQLDVGTAGEGAWAGQSARGNLILIAVMAPGQKVTILDSVGDDTAPALLVVLLGEAGAGLTIELAGVRRPTALFAFNAGLQASPGSVWNGALFLNPGCRFSAPAGPAMHVAHLAYAASSTEVAAGAVVADLAMPPSLEALMPLVRYACANPVLP
ncbi:hypothetical protein GALL_84660 [mine drainage metagenome]|uniref:Uncharacterized protein n=1 Tax=mine drainage metagenome TaxID=410659 RepID=A0A1J5T5Z5_9ZZZZ